MKNGHSTTDERTEYSQQTVAHDAFASLLVGTMGAGILGTVVGHHAANDPKPSPQKLRRERMATRRKARA